MDVSGTCVFISCHVFNGYVVYSLVTVLTYVLCMLQIESENVLSYRHVPITTTQLYYDDNDKRDLSTPRSVRSKLQPLDHSFTYKHSNTGYIR